MKVLRHLHDWFVPHWRNAHRPHLARKRGLVAVVVLLTLINGGAWLATPTSLRAARGSVLGYAADVTPVALLADTNDERIKAKLAPLQLDARLNRSATLKAGNMFDENYWAHVSPSGLQPWHWFSAAGYTYALAGENLARDFDTSAGVTAGWMASPGHRANLLNADYTDVGFAVVNGRLGGQETTLVVAHYGRSIQASAPVAVGATVLAASPGPTPSPAPAPTVAAQPTIPVAAPEAPSSTPGPTLIATPADVAAPAEPPPANLSLAAISAATSWPVKATLLVLIILLSVYVGAHLAAWRRRLPNWYHLHYHVGAGARMAGVLVAIGYFATVGIGRVG